MSSSPYIGVVTSGLQYVGSFASTLSGIRVPKKDPVLDPMLTAITIALLNNEPLGTKININDFDLSFSPPTITQGVHRWQYSQSHEDLIVLGDAFRKVVFQYLSPESEGQNSSSSSSSTQASSTTSSSKGAAAAKKAVPTKQEAASDALGEADCVKIIFEGAVKGLQALQKTYPNSTTKDAASNWIDLLSGKVKIDTAPIITPMAEKVKATWKLFYLQEFASCLQTVSDVQDKISTSEDAKKKYEFTLRKIRNLMTVKQGEFEEIIAFNNVM